MEPSQEVLSKVEEQVADLVLVALVWPSQSWYPKLLGLLVTNPLIVDPQEEVIVVIVAQMLELTPSLAMWPISGNITQVKDFQVRLKISCCHRGDRSPDNPMTHCKKWISWCTERLIQFWDL